MTTPAERQEMVEEVETFLGYGNHVMTLLERAAQSGDKEAFDVAFEVGQRHGQIRGRGRIAALDLRARTWPETKEQWRARQDAANAAYRSEVGAALAQRNERRRAQKQKIVERSKPSIGWNVPPKDGVEYARPEGSSFNTPIGADKSEQRGSNKIRAMYNRTPEES